MVVDEFRQRFGGVGRLVSTPGLERLRAANVCVIGVGGVGSWVVEALARCGVGSLTLVDLDEVCVTNVNRQIQALTATVGRSKVELLAERVRAINPECVVRPILEFFTRQTADEILGTAYDYVVDAIDWVERKCELIVGCRERRLPIVCSGGAGGRMDPTRVRIEDLARVTHDRLLGEVRARLRHEHGFPRAPRKMGVECVFSAEPQVFPREDGTVCATRDSGQTGADLRLNCDAGFGTAAFVTGAFGFAAAGRVVRRLTEPGRQRTS